jgi:NDP-sugar pyrophosphorylase family protein
MSYDIIYLNAGRGTRTWPMALIDPFIFQSKSLSRLFGIPGAEREIFNHVHGGAQNLHVVCQHGPNRWQLADRINRDSGNIYNIDKVTWTHPLRDIDNTGSAGALFQAIDDQPDLADTAIVLPNDNLFGYDVYDAMKQHRKSGAVMTVLTAMLPAQKTLGMYGQIYRDENRMLGMAEKLKTLEELSSLFGYEVKEDTPIPTSGGAYIIDIRALREISRQDWAIEKRNKSFDIATDLIPRLRHVNTYDLDSWADLGGLDLFLETMQRTLNREFEYLIRMIETTGHYIELPGNVWVHRETLYEINAGGDTLENMMNSTGPDRVELGPNVFLGRNIAIYPGAKIRYSNIEKDCKIGTNVIIDSSYLGVGAQIAENAQIIRSIATDYSQMGPHAVLFKSVLGRDVNLPTGNYLEECAVWPLTRFDGEAQRYVGKILLNKALMDAAPEGHWPTKRHQKELLYTLSQF